MTATTQCNPAYQNCTSAGTTIPFESIQEPGCYICNWSGHLLRVPEDGVAAGRSPLISIVGGELSLLSSLAALAAAAIDILLTGVGSCSCSCCWCRCR